MNFDIFLYHFEKLLVDGILSRANEINKISHKPHLQLCVFFFN